MNWDSFVPDLMVGLVTGGLVGAVVLGAERRLSNRARRLEVTNAEGVVVEKARSVLRHPIHWKHQIHDLTPDRTQLDRLVPVVAAVPTGDPLERFPGAIHAHRVVELLDEVESVADAVFTAQAKHKLDTDLLAVSDAILHNLQRLLDHAHDGVWSWEWPEPGGYVRLTPAMKSAVESDLDLRGYMDEYVRNRRLLEAHREAFVLADGAWRADEWAALLAKTRNAPRFFLTRWYRSLVYRRAVRGAIDGAEKLGYEIVAAVDNMAY